MSQAIPPVDGDAGAPFWRPLALVLLIGLAAQGAMINEFLRVHPAAQFPLADGEVYWEMAGEVAAGHWRGDTPFLSAPLYPYLLGLLRTMGVSLAGVYWIQALILLTTAAVTACTARRRFGNLVGVLAAALFLLCSDVAVSSMRVLGNAVQLLLVALLWQQAAALAMSDNRRAIRAAACGALTGLLALTYPAALLLVPALAVWIGWESRRSGPRIATTHAGVAVACALIAIAPATIHNWVVAHEIIPITAHAGVTLRHGNQAESKGFYTPIPGMAPGRVGLHESAAELYRQANGRPGTWKEVDRFFRGQAVDFYLHSPLAGAKLAATKAYLYLTCRHYDDITLAALDRRAGLADMSWLAPLAMPWVMGLSLAGIWVLRGSLRSHATEWAIPLLTALVVVVFFYSPRYRLPAAPMLVTLAALAITKIRHLPTPGPRLVALGLAVLIPAFSIGNEVMGYDAPSRASRVYNHILSATYLKLARRQMSRGESVGAEASLRAAQRAEPGAVEPLMELGRFLARAGDFDQAQPLFSQAAEREPRNLEALRDLYHAAVARRDLTSARETLRRILDARAGSRPITLALAWLLSTSPDATLRDGKSAMRLMEPLMGDASIEVRVVAAAALAESGQHARARGVAEQPSSVGVAPTDRMVKVMESIKSDLAAGRPVTAPPWSLPPTSQW